MLVYPGWRVTVSVCGYFAHLLVNLFALAYLVSFYSHTVRNVFNKQRPALFSDPSFLSFYNYFLLVRPISIMWRKATWRLRVLPDALILGEVRCGTTVMSAHLRSFPGCHPPFCPWKHPELDCKETFYFVGHYNNNVSPSGYRMCFPLITTKWFYTKVSMNSGHSEGRAAHRSIN